MRWLDVAARASSRASTCSTSASVSDAAGASGLLQADNSSSAASRSGIRRHAWCKNTLVFMLHSLENKQRGNVSALFVDRLFDATEPYILVTNYTNDHE
jgi:hypothetical protein